MLARMLNGECLAASGGESPLRLLAASKFKVQKFYFVIGERLEREEVSPNGLYALMAKDFCLRISLHHKVAQLHSEDTSRYLSKVFLIT